MINTVASATEKRGDNVLDGEIIITEKLDTFRFIFEKKTGDINFYKKDYTPINIIERTITDMWEDAIYDITESVKHIDIPEGYYFGVSYTPVEQPLRIPYPNLPKYILTDVLYKDKKVKKSLDIELVTEWSKKLNIGAPPILFKGKLDEHQKSILIAYDKRDFDSIKDVEFSSILNGVIGSTYSKGQLVEGIIINNNYKPMQIESHEFSLLRESYDRIQSNRVLYDMVIMHMNKYLEYINISECDRGEQGYIDIICELFNEFIENSDVMNSVLEQELTPTHYGYMGRMNKTWISNTRTLEYLCENEVNVNIFKIFLNGLRKPKKVYGLLNETVVENINKYVKNINEHCFGVNEDSSNNILVGNISNERNDGDLGNMKIISSIRKAFNSEVKDHCKGSESVMVFVSNFSPFTASEYALIEQMYNKYKLNIVLCHYNSSKAVIGDKYIVSDNLVNAQMKSLVDTIPFIIDAISLNNDTLDEMFRKCRPKYEPLLLLCTNNSASDYINQLYFYEQVNGGKLDVMDNFNINEHPKGDDIVVLQTIENEDAISFKENTPKCVHWLWDNILNEYKLWTGSILQHK